MLTLDEEDLNPTAGVMSQCSGSTEGIRRHQLKGLRKLRHYQLVSKVGVHRRGPGPDKYVCMPPQCRDK